MKNLIKHLLENNFEEILSRSLLHCHAQGLHSIMLLEAPGKTIRLYVAVKGNDLHKNFYRNFKNNGMSIAFHPHHCNLTLHCIKGWFYNWEVTEGSIGECIETTKFLYKSKIKSGDTDFTKVQDNAGLQTTNYRLMKEGDCVMMKANEIHTVACPSDQVTSWIVFEGKENGKHVDYCWSNQDLTKQDFSGLYQKTNAATIHDLISLSGILV